MPTMVSPAPIRVINNSRASRGHGLGITPCPSFNARDISVQVSNESGNPSWAAVAAALSPTTGSSS